MGVPIIEGPLYTRNNILCTPAVRFTVVRKLSNMETALPQEETPIGLQLEPNVVDQSERNVVELLDVDNVADAGCSGSTKYTSSTPRDLEQTPRRIIRSHDLDLLKPMLVVTTVFLFLNIPSYLCRLFLTDSGPFSSFLWEFSYLLYYGHHAVMCYLYIFNSRQMKKEFKPAAVKLLECYCLKTVPDFGHDTPVQSL